MRTTVELRLLKQDSPENLLSLQKVFAAAPSYWMNIMARLPEKNAAAETFKALPDGKTYDDNDSLLS